MTTNYIQHTYKTNQVTISRFTDGQTTKSQ